jgi:hypothetical protein
MHSGWLVPTHPQVEEKEIKFIKNVIGRKSRWKPSNTSRFVHLLGEGKEVSSIGLSLSTPGPKFLHLLEQALLDIVSDPEEELIMVYGVPNYEYHGREKVVIDGKTSFFDFTGGIGWGDSYPFCMFMEGFNKCFLPVKDGQLIPINRWDKFPREMIRFYGVERLRIMEEGEAEDWKKLPMLLWE